MRINKFVQALAIIILSPLQVFSFSSVSKAHDVNGDYFVSNFPTDGTYFLNRWKVVSPGLKCFSRAGEEFDTLAGFAEGDILDVPVSLGRTSNVDPIYLDSRGKPWMIVMGSNRSRFGNGGICFVRANEEFIVPE